MTSVLGSAPGASPAAGARHQVPLAGTAWSVWRDAALRSAGFPADRVLAICDEEKPIGITPVELTPTWLGRRPSAVAASCAIRAVSFSPWGPVQQFALPLFTTTARKSPAKKSSARRAGTKKSARRAAPRSPKPPMSAMPESV